MAATKADFKKKQKDILSEKTEFDNDDKEGRSPANDSKAGASRKPNLNRPRVEKNRSSQLKVLTRKRKRSQHPLRELRLQRGYTLEELAELTELSPSYLSRLESGSRRLNADILQRLSSILSCHPGELLNHSSHSKKYVVNNNWKRSHTEPQPISSFAQDLPLYKIRPYEEKGEFVFTSAQAREWIARPPELYSIPRSFAFVIEGEAPNLHYRIHDRIFAHPTRPLTRGCMVMAITHQSKAYIGEFEGWKEHADRKTPVLLIRINGIATGRDHSRVLELERNDLKTAYRLIGSMETAA